MMKRHGGRFVDMKELWASGHSNCLQKDVYFILLYILKGHRIAQLPIRFGTRSLCTAHTLRTPEVTSQNFSNKFNPRYAQEDEEDEYEIDDDELEKLRQQHREEARTQHKAKEGYVKSTNGFGILAISPPIVYL